MLAETLHSTVGFSVSRLLHFKSPLKVTHSQLKDKKQVETRHRKKMTELTKPKQQKTIVSLIVVILLIITIRMYISEFY